MRKSFVYAENVIKENNGIIKTGQAKKSGVDPKTLVQMTNEGILIKEGRGIYRLASLPPLGNPDLVNVALRMPYGIICLISALAFHNLTTQIPYRIYVAVPKGKKAPRIDYPPLEVVTLTDKRYSSGIEIHNMDGVDVSIYNEEKTIADCFMFRNKIGVGIAIEALKDYFHKPNPKVQKLVEYSEINRVRTVMQPYLESMI